jgi:GTP-binding protein
MFVDRVEIQIQAGDGGDGCLSFRREKYVPYGGPDGGDGGNGGDVIILAEPGVDSLVALAHRKQWRAASGTNGQGAMRHGRQGDSLILKVPPGTVVSDAENRFVIKDLTTPGDQFVAARGGRGGRGNAHFKSSTNRAPRKRTSGGDGELRRIVLELKVIADVGLLGRPNAGKSTLLSRLSHARPEIADYPFTTKYPNLGLVQAGRDRSFVLADIPGLLEGAHAGVGLGLEFLKHIQRAGILVHLVEPTPQDGSDPLQNYLSIRDELGHFDPALLVRPEIVVVSKCELPGAADVADRLATHLQRPVLSISAVSGYGLPKLIEAILAQLDAQTNEDHRG